MHEALVTTALKTSVVGHVSRDSTAIEARDKPAPKPDKSEEEKEKEKPKRKRGQPRKGEEVVKEEKRIDRHLQMTLPEMIADLPNRCNRGSKRNAKGHSVSWNGYKPLVHAEEGGITLGCLLTSASTHDSQATIPMATQTGQCVTYLYEFMDYAYDAEQIYKYSEPMGYVAIIDSNPRGDKTHKEALPWQPKAQRSIKYPNAETVGYTERTTIERVNACPKDDVGGRHVRARGPAKVSRHLIFGILELKVEQISASRSELADFESVSPAS